MGSDSATLAGMRRAFSQGWISGAFLSLSVLACGDDSKPIAEQWPDYTAGQANDSQSSQTQPDSSSSSASSSSASGQSGGSTSTDQSTSGLETLPGSTQAPGLCAPENFRCVAAVPVGWHGPVARRGMSATGIVGACEGEYRFPINAVRPFLGNPSADPAACSPCSCGRAQGASCSDLLNVPYFKKSGCNNDDLLLTVPKVLADGSCVKVSNPVGRVQSLRLPTPTLDRSGSFCTPTGGFVTKAPARWQQQERWCRARVADSLRCSDATKVCVPKVQGVFEPGVCVFQEGEHACPAGEYQTRVLLYRGEKDERRCSACSCGEVKGELACEGFLRQFSNDRCSDAATERVESSRIDPKLPDTCQALSNFADSVPQSVQLELSVGGLGEAKCDPSGGAALGEVRGKDPVTLCCTSS